MGRTEVMSISAKLRIHVTTNAVAFRVSVTVIICARDMVTVAMILSKNALIFQPNNGLPHAQRTQQIPNNDENTTKLGLPPAQRNQEENKKTKKKFNFQI